MGNEKGEEGGDEGLGFVGKRSGVREGFLEGGGEREEGVVGAFLVETQLLG